MPEQPCAFHPDKLTAVSCSNCGRPICSLDMIEAPVGYQCPICTGRAREGTFGAASYRTRSAVSRQVDRVPFARRIRSAGMTQVLVAANVAVFILMLFAGRRSAGSNIALFGGADPGTLYDFGALTVPLLKDQWWRLFSSMFVHIGLLHLAFNMYALLTFGPAIEQRYGKLRFLALYFGSGFLGGAATLVFTKCPDGVPIGACGVSAGASGAVFGILGAWIAFFLRHRAARGASEQLRSLFILVGINLFIGFSVRFINNYAHIGGLIGGFAVAFVLEQSARLKDRALREVGGLLGFAAVATAGLVALFASGRFV